MKYFFIHLAFVAEKDINNVYHYISDILMLPIAAIKYHNGIYDTIMDLSTTADIYAFTQNEFIQSQYGSESRTVRYKKMVIIYNVIVDKVFVRRVIAGSLVR